jgi:hypothetical protein
MMPVDCFDRLLGIRVDSGFPMLRYFDFGTGPRIGEIKPNRFWLTTFDLAALLSWFLSKTFDFNRQNFPQTHLCR